MATASAQVDVVARGGVYQDSDETTIGTATTAVRGTVAEVVQLRARYLADIISSASVDVVSAATPSFDEVRHEAEGGAAYADGTRTIGATYIYSQEPDWMSHTASLGFGHDLFDHQLTLGASATVVVNDIGRAEDPNFARELTQGTGTLSAALVVSRDDLVSLAYSLTYSAGYHASPYRMAYLADSGGVPIAHGMPEIHPDSRLRHALAARYNRYVFKESALRSHLRGYVDDWGLWSLTAGTEYVIGFGPVEVGALVRGYLQGAAAFYQSIYPAPQRFMTADRELGGFADVFGGARAAWRQRIGGVVEELRADVKAEGFYFDFFDFPRLPNRHGVVAELGLGATF